MARPTDLSTSFLRDPRGDYKHDGFGHDNRQEAKGIEPCFRIGPHSGLDFTGRGPIFSIAGGVVTASEWTSRAGNALVEDVTIPGLGKVIDGSDRVYPIYFHAASRMLAEGTPTKPGQRLGTIGDTGTGTSRGAFHLHLSIARTREAALALIRGGTPPRWQNESVSAWAKRAGLVDPLLVLDFLDSVRGSVPSGKVEPANPAILPTPESEPTMRYIQIDHSVKGHAENGRVFAVNIATGKREWIDDTKLSLSRRADAATTGRVPEVLVVNAYEAYTIFELYERLV